MTSSNLSQLGFPYVIIRSKRKSAAIHVKANRVEVRIPHFVDDQWALHFLSSKRHWVLKKINQQAEHISLRPEVKNGAKLLWKGKARTLCISSQSQGVMVEGDRLTVAGRTPEQATVQLQSFFKQEAKQYLLKRTQQLAEAFGFKTKLKNIKFRRTKTKWGHCTSTGDIQFNWLIMGAPPSVIDYLIIHELSHLIHQDHSHRFWTLVEQNCPNYKQEQAWLKENSMALSWC